MTKRDFLLLLLIFLIGAFLRFYKLGEIPVGFHRDEAFLGYNAYSILKTGKDISGHFLPLHLESFIYSPAGYSYLSIPFIALFDLSAFSVRFASALFGSLTILVTYFLVKEIFSGYVQGSRGALVGDENFLARNASNRKIAKKLLAGAARENFVSSPRQGSTLEILSLLSAGLLAISPWHINLSRTATENTIVVFFISVGVLLYLLWLRKKSWYLVITSFVSFGLTILIYQAPRAFLPLFIPLMIVLLSRVKLEWSRFLSILVLFFIVIIFPLLIILSSKDLSLRIRTVSIFSGGETQLSIDQYIREDGVSGIPILTTRIFHNKIVGYSSEFLKNYFSHFSYDFLFTDKAFPDRYRIPGMGLLYIFELPFILLGVWSLLQKEIRRAGLFLIVWILLAPVGSALAFDDIPNIQRTLIIFPALSIISAYGILTLLPFLERTRMLKKAVMVLLGIAIIYSFFSYLHQYYIHGRLYRPWYRQDGYKALVAKVNALLPNYTKAVVTNRESAPTIFFLFYSKYNPSRFQQETKNTTMRDFDRIGFSKYEFSQDECPLRSIKQGEKISLSGEQGVLYVNSGLCDVPNGTRVISTVNRADYSLVFYLLEL